MPSHLPSSARRAVLAPLDPRGRVAEVERRLSDAIRVGVFGDGDQLPRRGGAGGAAGRGDRHPARGARGAAAHGAGGDAARSQRRHVRARAGRGGARAAARAARRAERGRAARPRRPPRGDRGRGGGARGRAGVGGRPRAAGAARRAAGGRRDRRRAARRRRALPRRDGGDDALAPADARGDGAADRGGRARLARRRRGRRRPRAGRPPRDPRRGPRARRGGRARADGRARGRGDGGGRRAPPRARGLAPRGDAARHDGGAAHAARRRPRAARAPRRDAPRRARPRPRRARGRVRLRRRRCARPCSRCPPSRGARISRPCARSSTRRSRASRCSPARAWSSPPARSPTRRAGSSGGAACRAARPCSWTRRSTPAIPTSTTTRRAEWFTTPRDTGERWIAGPFVDHSGTNEHILTLTLPVVRDGAFLGVAGADIAVGAIEAVGGAALAAVAGEAALVNHRGRIIATNTPRRLVGTLWRRASTTSRSATRGCSGACSSPGDGGPSHAARCGACRTPLAEGYGLPHHRAEGTTAGGRVNRRRTRMVAPWDGPPSVAILLPSQQPPNLRKERTAMTSTLRRLTRAVAGVAYDTPPRVPARSTPPPRSTTTAPG